MPSRAVQDLAQSYSSVVGDCTRVKNRLKAWFRAGAIPCSGTAMYSTEDREQWLARLNSIAARARASRLWQELDCLEKLRAQAEQDAGGGLLTIELGAVLLGAGSAGIGHPGMGFAAAACLTGAVADFAAGSPTLAAVFWRMGA